MKLSAFKNKTRKIEIEHQGETLHVEYRLNVVTPTFMDELRSIENTDESLTRQIREVVVHWDLEDEDGQEIKPTVEVIRSIPRPFWIKILDAIVEDMGVSAETKND